MKKILGLGILFLLISNSYAMAANFAVITSPSTFLNIFVLFAVIGCGVGSFKILSLLKGGQLFKSWQIFMFGFIVLALCELVILLNIFEIFHAPQFVVPTLLFITFGLFFYGIWETKRTLD